MIITGKVFKYGDNINTDVIIPARYLNVSAPDELKKHCMEDIDADFKDNVKNGDIIVCGKNFGSGSSREHAPIAIKASGIQLVIASSFARIFYRNAINIGLNLIIDDKIALDVNNFDVLTVDYEKSTIFNVTQNKYYDIPKFSDFINKIVKAGGLVELVKEGGL